MGSCQSTENNVGTAQRTVEPSDDNDPVAAEAVLHANNEAADLSTADETMSPPEGDPCPQVAAAEELPPASTDARDVAATSPAPSILPVAAVALATAQFLLLGREPTPVAQRRPAEACGITLAALRGLRKRISAAVGTKATTQQLVDRFVKPTTEAYKCRLADLLTPEHVQPPSFFVSHTWKNAFDSIVEHLEQFAAGQGLPGDTAFWLDIAAVNQHVGAGQEEDLRAFDLAIRNARATLLVLDGARTALTRVWCVYELWRTVLGGPKKLIALHPSVSFYRLRDIFHSVDLEAAEATFPADRERILADVRSSIGSAKLNEVVKRALVDSCALSDPIAALVEAARSGAGGDATAAAAAAAAAVSAAGADASVAGELARKQGKLLMHSGRYLDAEPYLRASLELFSLACGGKPASYRQYEYWSDGYHDLATLLFFAGRYAEAEHLHRQALRLREQGMGPTDPLVTYSLNNLADVLAAGAEAAMQGRAAGQAGGERGGAQAAGEGGGGGEREVETLLEEAEQLYRRCLSIRHQAMGRSHPLTAMTQAGLSRLLLLHAHLLPARLVPDAPPGRLEKARDLAQASLTTREKVFGPEHFEVAFSLLALGECHEAELDLAVAEVHCRRALGIRRGCLDSAHPLVADGGVALARVLLARAGRWAGWKGRIGVGSQGGEGGSAGAGRGKWRHGEGEEEGWVAEARGLLEVAVPALEAGLAPEAPALARARELLCLAQ